MEELRIDCLHQTEEELGVVKELRQNIFRLNHTMPDTEEYRELLHKVFPHFGENCRIEYDRCRKSSQVNQENIDYGFFGKSHFNKVNFITKSFDADAPQKGSWENHARYAVRSRWHVSYIPYSSAKSRGPSAIYLHQVLPTKQ